MMIKTPYEAINPIKKIPSWVFWLILGWIVIGFTGQILGFYFGTHHLPIGRTIYGFVTPILLVSYIGFHHGYKKVMQGMSSILSIDDENFDIWLFKQEENIFTFKTLISKLYTAIVIIATTISVACLDGYVSEIHRMLFILWTIPGSFICAHGTYIVFALLVSIYNIAKRPVKVPFFLLPHPAISNLQGYFSKGASSITILFILFVIVAYEAAHADILSAVWICVLGAHPLLMFLWSIIQIHLLMKQIKSRQVEVINTELDNTMTTFLSDKNTDNLNRLEKFIEIQRKVQFMTEWPINLQGMFTFFFTLITAAIPIIISILSK